MSPPPTVKSALASLETYNLPTPKVAVIVGGTTGIGAAIARRLARAGCAKVIVVGRNAERAGQVIDEMKALAKGKFEGVFVKADLGLVKTMRKAVDVIKRAVGTDGIDYLVQCQNGIITGTVNINEDGIGAEFAVQCISRFLIPYLIIASSTLNSGASVLSIGNAGQDLPDLDVSDLSLEVRARQGKSRTALCMQQGARDGSVIDAFMQEMRTRYPQYSFYHLSPGLVATELFALSSFPPIARIIVWIGLKTSARTPDEYAVVPAYVLLKPDGQQALGEPQMYGPKLEEIKLGAWANNAQNRFALWSKLTALIGVS